MPVLDLFALFNCFCHVIVLVLRALGVRPSHPEVLVMEAIHNSNIVNPVHDNRDLRDCTQLISIGLPPDL